MGSRFFCVATGMEKFSLDLPRAVKNEWDVVVCGIFNSMLMQGGNCLTI